MESAEEIRIATAYFEGSGFQVLQETLQGKRIRLLVGRKEGGADSLREVINEFVEELSYGPLDSRSRAMQQMLEALEKGWMTVAVGETLPADAPWMDARYLYHHAKLYIADEQTVVVTSANFSGHGLCRSREAGITIHDPELDTVLADSRGHPLEESWRRDEVMRVIRCFEETPKDPARIYPTPDEFDSWIKKARQEWAEKQNLDPAQLQIVCALALVPKTG